MATIKQELDDAAIECGIALPPAWLASTSQDSRVFLALLRSVVRDLLDRHAWSGASATAVISPAVETQVWPLPADFVRIQQDTNAVFEVSPNRRPVMPLPVDGDFAELQAWGASGAQRYFRRTPGGIEFYRPLPPGSEVKFAYVSSNWIVGGKSEWTIEIEDVPVWPSQLLRFGLIYRWRRQKGLRFADEQAEFESILARAIGDDRPTRVIGFGGSPARHPMRVPIPDFIPAGS